MMTIGNALAIHAAGHYLALVSAGVPEQLAQRLNRDFAASMTQAVFEGRFSLKQICDSAPRMSEGGETQKAESIPDISVVGNKPIELHLEKLIEKGSNYDMVSEDGTASVTVNKVEGYATWHGSKNARVRVHDDFFDNLKLPSGVAYAAALSALLPWDMVQVGTEGKERIFQRASEVKTDEMESH